MRFPTPTSSSPRPSSAGTRTSRVAVHQSEAARLQSLIAAGHRGTIPSQGPSRQRASGGTSEGRHVVTERAGHRPGLHSRANRERMVD